MSGIGPTEILLLVVIGLLILGPERLPRVATQIGRWVGRARRTANQLRYQLEREVALADIDEANQKRKQQAGGKAAAPDTGAAGPTESATAADKPDPEASAPSTPDAGTEEPAERDADDDVKPT